MCHLSPGKTFKTIFLLIHLLSFSSSFAGDFLSPESIEGSERISSETLIKLAHEHDDLVIIDSRIKADRHQGFISGSTSLPDTETNCTSLFTVIDKKHTPTVFYCNGVKCRRSDRAVAIARDCGYTKLYWFRGGFEEWKDKNYLISK